MDIEDRAERYAEGFAPTSVDGVPLSPEHRRQLHVIVRDAYLAGSAQTQADYVQHYARHVATFVQATAPNQILSKH